MLKIGVRLPRRFEDSGEYLADARALDAAGVDSLWLDDEGYDPWLLLAGIAAVTGRARLVAPVGAAAAVRTPPSSPTAWRPSPGSSHGRCVLSLTRRRRRLHRQPDRPGPEPRPARDRRGRRRTTRPGRRALWPTAWSVLDDSCEALKASLPPLLRARDEAEVHRAARGLGARRRCRRTASSGGRCSATGRTPAQPASSSPHDPRLLDQLRNGDEDDDRSDLQLAQG